MMFSYLRPAPVLAALCLLAAAPLLWALPALIPVERTAPVFLILALLAASPLGFVRTSALVFLMGVQALAAAFFYALTGHTMMTMLALMMVASALLILWAPRPRRPRMASFWTHDLPDPQPVVTIHRHHHIHRHPPQHTPSYEVSRAP